MLKVKFEYDLPEYDPLKHDPDKTFAIFDLSWSPLC